MANRRPTATGPPRGPPGPRPPGPPRDAHFPPPPDEFHATDVIHLNVGGKQFDTLFETLTHGRSTYFDAFLQISNTGRVLLLRHNVIFDRQNRVFINRDPKLFAYVLQYLRDGSRAVDNFPDDVVLLRQLIREGEFFAMQKFVQSLMDKLDDVERRQAEKDARLESIHSAINQINNSLYVNSFRK